MNPKVPTVGRAVHFTPGGLGFDAGTFFHATIARVNADGTVSLGCLDLDGCAFPLQGVAFTEAKAGTEEARGCWSWPVIMSPAANARADVAPQPTADAVHAPDPPPGPKGPTKAAVDEAIRCIKKAKDWLDGALGEINGGLDLDECQNWLRETRLYVVEAERAIQYARDIRGHRQSPAPAPVVQEWGPEPGQRPVPADEGHASAESKAARDAFDRARDQAARAGHPDPDGAALAMLAEKHGGA